MRGVGPGRLSVDVVLAEMRIAGVTAIRADVDEDGRLRRLDLRPHGSPWLVVYDDGVVLLRSEAKLERATFEGTVGDAFAGLSASSMSPTLAAVVAALKLCVC
jgi:hypothetical protein